jgi:hypothetical protein
MLRIEVLGERREPDEVGEEDRHPPTLGGGTRAGGRPTSLGRLCDLVTAGAAESESRAELGATSGAGLCQRPSAATAEPKAGRILECADRAAHSADSVRRRADATV